MKIEFEVKIIELVNDQNFSPFSADNLNRYNYQYISNEIVNQEFYVAAKLGILVKDYEDFEERLVNSAVICEVGSALNISKDSVLVEGNNLLVCICDKVYCINLPDLKLNWKVKADEGVCFSIHKFNEGFIIHGELEITCLSKSGEIIWQFSARDIFVTVNSEKEFRIENNIIIVRDWSDYEYYLSAEGKVIKEIKPTHNTN